MKEIAAFAKSGMKSAKGAQFCGGALNRRLLNYYIYGTTKPYYLFSTKLQLALLFCTIVFVLYRIKRKSLLNRISEEEDSREIFYFFG